MAEYWPVYDEYGFVAARDSLLSPKILSAMFLHGDIFHLLFNMLFLFVFGRGVEDVLGYVRFIILYFASGILGSWLFKFFEPDLLVPSIGASGAISGVLGAYLVLLPRFNVTVLFVYWSMVRLITVTAKVIIGIWIAFQILYALVFSSMNTGIAYTAHLGGFAAGIIIAIILKRFSIPKESKILYDTSSGSDSYFQRYRSQLYEEPNPPSNAPFPPPPTQKAVDPFEDFLKRRYKDEYPKDPTS